ncbi:MAG: hypothetical protein ACTSRZ_13685 [Promethearchaeota archaeon]
MDVKPKDYIKGIFISKMDGTYLVSISFDENLKIDLLSSFIAGLSMFGKETVGFIDEIIIKGLDLEIFVVQKHELILTVLFSSKMKKQNIRGEAENALNAFHENFKEYLHRDIVDINMFKPFEQTLHKQIEEYFEKIGRSSEDNEKKGERLNFWHIILEKIGKK